MGKLRKFFKPYTFRDRLMLALLIASVLAAIISLIFSYSFSHADVRDELIKNQTDAAGYLLDLSRKTDLSLDDMMTLTRKDGLSIRVLDARSLKLSPDTLVKLQRGAIHTVQHYVTELPVTYVMVDQMMLQINSTENGNLVVLALFRILFATISFLLVFAALSIVAARRIAKPITAMTHATRVVKNGNFDVRLPENLPGEVGELMSSFNSMTETLGRTSYLQKDFISSVSHEFRTPIASIKGYAKLLKMPDLSEDEREEYIDYISKEADRLSRLSETLLRLSALEQQSGPANLTTFRLDEQLRQAIVRLEPAWSDKNISWQLELDEMLVETDEALLMHVWSNIIHNAVKFSPEGGNITIRLTGENAAVVEITDEGPGMDEATVSRIFDRFYQSDASRHKEGVGLGLSLVKRILDILGGKVNVKTQPGCGSTFRVEIPLHPTRNI